MVSAVSPGGREAETDPTRPGFPVRQAASTTSVSFLKEQQWRTEFATDWIVEGALHRSVSGPARVAAAAGGETTLTAIVDATVTARSWPFPGLDVTAAKEVFRLVPRPSERGLPDLQADAVSLEADVDMTRSRVQRLTELLRVEATSVAELERAKATLTGLEARLQSARKGVNAVSGSPESGDGVPVRTPWSGTIAEVFVAPGQTVVAGSPLARLVRNRPLWIILELRPEDTARVQRKVSGLFLRRPGSAQALEVPSGDLRIVSRSPELDSLTGTVKVIVEARRGIPDLPIGSAVEAELLLGGEVRGIVVPVTSLVDDAGITVAYVQIEGESFERKELRIVVRQGARALVEGLETGERLVTRGSAAIRRSALLSSGSPQGHVH